MTTSRQDEDLLLAVVRDLVAERHTVDRAAPATLDSEFDHDLGLDSLGVTELLARTEDAFGVSLDRGVLATVETPRDLMTAVRRAPSQSHLPSIPVRHPAPPPIARTPDATATLTEALSWHARTHPDRVHLRILSGGTEDEGTQDEVGYGELQSAAATVSAALLARDLRPGERAAIMLPTGRDYFTTFLGVLLAGGVPVPVYPPARPSQLAEHLRRQVHILGNAQACVLVTDPEAARLARLVRGQVQSVRHVLTPNELTGYGEAAGAVRGADDIALLQYTSGSTGDPKGVTLTHANLLSNIRAMGTATGVSTSDVFVSWLPLYHDMGLIGAWLSSLYFGVPLAVMSPLEFLARPARWLWAIDAHLGTLSAAPNFAFELCMRKITDAELGGLDLSSLRMVFNGAEPVSADTVTRFAERFAAYGLRRQAQAPVYGLAEACVGLTLPPVGRGPVVDRVDRERFLRTGRAIRAADADLDPLRFVGCGQAIPNHHIRVVDSAGNVLGDRREGRIEFRGPSATTGYFRNPRATKALLRHGWLDTGDLGYLDGGELYVTGRIKDLIIRAGRNLHPEELERAVGDIPGIRKGCVVVFATSGHPGGTERLVVLAETRQTADAVLTGLRERIIGISIDLLGTPPDDIVLAPPGTVPKTSSGKLRRAATRHHYEQGDVRARPRPVWWQLARFGARGVLPRLRRAGTITSTGAYALWCWSVVVAVGLPTLIAVALVPGLGARRVVVHAAARSLARLTGAPVTANGVDRLAQVTSCVVVANHASFLDGIAMSTILPHHFTFVAGEVFEHKPLVGFLLRRIGTRFVERTEREQSVADTGHLEEAAAGGEPLVVFPEGSLSPVPGLRPFHMGAFVIAARAGLPVVPVAISGTRAMMWPDRGTIIHRGAIHLTVAEPILPVGNDWTAATVLERKAHAAIAAHCGEPDIGR
ncbi:AMP-binding protein [Rhodococcus sp. WB9]|uniref:AMP-binding protein n=1 Tax=Rhodococcus sp. WB9 TaxID=2594007 RepID=UPI001186C3B4|nr:AMP-binding protein [Rhodococcus sp. WB9]QDQ92399.1 AMP-binding protein [Rhodococcus sp. WB9]